MPRSRHFLSFTGSSRNSCYADRRHFKRRIRSDLRDLLDSSPAVALIGPRQVGKTTLVLEIGEIRPSIYLDLDLDLESDADRARLGEPELYLSRHADKLVILDEVHRLPNLFQNLCGLIDRGRRSGRKAGQFLLRGSASIDYCDSPAKPLPGALPIWKCISCLLRRCIKLSANFIHIREHLFDHYAFPQRTRKLGAANGQNQRPTKR